MKKNPNIWLKSLCLCASFLFLFSCGGDGTNNNGEDGETVMVVSERAYQNGTAMEGSECNPSNLSNAQNLDWSQVESGMVMVLLDAINAGANFDSYDWNTARGAAGTLTGDPLSFIRGNEVFLVYKVTYDEASGVAIVEVGVHQGNPYNPQSQPVLTLSGTAIIGEVVEINPGEEFQITSPCSAIFYAAKDAARQLLEQNFLEKVGLGDTPPSSSGTGG